MTRRAPRTMRQVEQAHPRGSYLGPGFVQGPTGPEAQNTCSATPETAWARRVFAGPLPSEAWRRHYFTCRTCLIGDTAADDLLCEEGKRLRDAALQEAAR